MRVYYEKLTDPIEQVYNGRNTVENVLFLEDIIRDINRDIYVQYKAIKTRSISYELGNLEIEDVVKVQNHSYFLYWHKDNYYKYSSFDNYRDNIIKIEVTNSNLLSGDYKISIYLNSVLLETHIYTDVYSLYNRKFIKIESEKLGTSLTITWPLRLNNGEYVEYTVNTVSVTEEPSVHKFLTTFDRNNNCLIFDRKYNNSEINVILKSTGSILRASTINELFKVNQNSMVQYDTASNKLIIPTEQVYKIDKTIKFIKNQEILIDPSNLAAGYNLIGIYLSINDLLTYDIIKSNTSYSTLISNINNFQLDTIKAGRSYIGFIIGLNNISTFIPTDTLLYNQGVGGGGGGSEKISLDCTNVESLEISYVASTACPLIQIYSQYGELVVPENIHYNLSNKITITFGQEFTGLVALI